jgi:hypothetical protein
MRPAEDLLKELGLDPEEAVKVLETATARVVSERLICSCGHSKAKHRVGDETTTCTPSTYSCPCRHWNAVMKVEDVRPFLWKTLGHGIDHALSRGITSMVKKGMSGEWVEGAHMCVYCKTEDDISIYAIRRFQDGQMQLATDLNYANVNAFVCSECVVANL